MALMKVADAHLDRLQERFIDPGAPEPSTHMLDDVHQSASSVKVE